MWRVESHPPENAKVPSTFQSEAGQPVLPSTGKPGSQGVGDIKQSDLPAATSKNGSKKPSKVHPKRKGGHRRKSKKHHVTASKVPRSLLFFTYYNCSFISSFQNISVEFVLLAIIKNRVLYKYRLILERGCCYQSSFIS